MKDGNIDSNPGPPTYTILKSVTGSFNQASTIFGETAGRQCVCNSLIAIARSIIRRVGIWTKENLNHILHQGDALYKSLGTAEYLTVEDIPDLIEVRDCQYRIAKLGMYQGKMCRYDNSTSFMNIHKSEENKATGYSFVRLQQLRSILRVYI